MKILLFKSKNFSITGSVLQRNWVIWLYIDIKLDFVCHGLWQVQMSKQVLEFPARCDCVNLAMRDCGTLAKFSCRNKGVWANWKFPWKLPGVYKQKNLIIAIANRVKFMRLIAIAIHNNRNRTINRNHNRKFTPPNPYSKTKTQILRIFFWLEIRYKSNVFFE